MKEFLSQNGVPWTEKYVDSDRGAAIEMIRRSGQQGVPVTVIGDRVIVGFDRPRLESAIAHVKAQPSSDGSGRRSLGASVADAGRHVLPGGTAVQGALVGGVRPGSPADKAGLKVGDVIVSAAGRPITTVDALSAALSGSEESSITLALVRGQNRREVTVQF